jgi:hypothetical protein
MLRVKWTFLLRFKPSLLCSRVLRALDLPVSQAGQGTSTHLHNPLVDMLAFPFMHRGYIAPVSAGLISSKSILCLQRARSHMPI